MAHNIKTTIARILPASFVCLATLALLFSFSSCNQKDSEELQSTPAGSVAIKDFKLRLNTKVLKDLDQVFFSVDLEHGVIFNADSLPKGTDVSALGITVTYADTPDFAEIEMLGGEKREGKIDFKKNPTDSIDFTGRVTLSIGLGDLHKTYTLKVNVHQIDPDSIIWANLDKAKLPSRMPNPQSQKSVQTEDNSAITLIQEADNSFTLAKTSNLLDNIWKKREISLPANPDIRSFNASGNELYILDNTGTLFAAKNIDGQSPVWQSKSENWIQILGNYGSAILGLRRDGNSILHTQYPAGTETIADPAFPVAGASNMALLTSDWAEHPTAILTGGLLADGSLSDAVWGYDGQQWVMLANSPQVARIGAALIPYYFYRRTGANWTQTEFPAWLLIGGADKNSAYIAQTAVSYDNCLHWQSGTQALSLPEEVQPAAYADPVLLYSLKTSNLSDAWTKIHRKRLPYEINGQTISWKCPYIFLIGGSTQSEQLQNQILRGVLARLSFTPLI